MLKVMIAEDNLIIADLLLEIIVKAGYHACGVARTVSEAIELGLSQKPHVAILDLGLADGRAATDIVPKLNVLDQLGILYTTGNVFHFGLTSANGHACLTKPYSTRTLLRSLEIVIDISASKTVSPPFPAGFRLLQSKPVLTLGQPFRL
jgi:two-component system, response regulator PdtaR